MSRPTALLTCSLLALATVRAASAAPGHGAAPKATGREAIRAVRHDWKSQVRSTVHTRQSQRLTGALPAGFGRLSATARLQYLLARRALDPARFDRSHPHMGPILALDERLRAAQGQDCRPMNGILKDSPHTRYMKFRRSLNPARFDLYHPTHGALLAEDERLRTGAGCVSPEIIPPPVVVTTPSTPSSSPQIIPPVGIPSPTQFGVNPQSVPEPGSLALIVIGSVGALAPRFLRRFRRRGQAEIA